MIKVIGTGHILKKSVEEVRNEILQDKPGIVALELDAERFKALEDMNWDLSYEREFPIKLNPVLIVQYLLSGIQRELGARFKILPGSEMKEAVDCAKKTGAKIFLIDRDIRITMLKLINIPFREKLLLGVKRENSGVNDLNELLEDDKIKDVVEEFKKFPNLYNALIEERNIYMAYVLSKIQEANPDKNIIAVVGAGHKEGIIRSLARIQNGEKINLSGILKTEKISLIKFLTLIPFILLLFLIYLIFKIKK